MKKLILKLKNILKSWFEIKDNLLLYLCNGEALPTILTDEEEIVPETGVNIKISFPKESSKEPIITMMARDLDINFSIVWGKLEKFRDSILGSLIINIEEENLEKVTKYLNDKKINFTVVEKGE